MAAVVVAHGTKATNRGRGPEKVSARRVKRTVSRRMESIGGPPFEDSEDDAEV